MSTRILQPLARHHQTPVVRHIPHSVKHEYGTGLSWPWSVRDNQWEITDGEYKIRDSIFVILSTPLGSRYMQPDFGSMLPLMVFTNYDAIARAELKRYTFQAVKRWEPRINLQQVQLNETELKDNAVGVELSYTISGTNSSAPHVARIPVQLDNGTIRFNNPAGYTLHGRRVF